MQEKRGKGALCSPVAAAARNASLILSAVDQLLCSQNKRKPKINLKCHIRQFYVKITRILIDRDKDSRLMIKFDKAEVPQEHKI